MQNNPAYEKPLRLKANPAYESVPPPIQTGIQLHTMPFIFHVTIINFYYTDHVYDVIMELQSPSQSIHIGT